MRILKISNIQHGYINKFTFPKTSFKGEENSNAEQINIDEFFEGNYNDTYNTEYKPIKYEKTTCVHGSQ